MPKINIFWDHYFWNYSTDAFKKKANRVSPMIKSSSCNTLGLVSFMKAQNIFLICSL